MDGKRQKADIRAAPPRMLNRRALTLAVLVVEDIATCLLEAGYLVIEAASGEEAISICKSEVPIDMVFTDINLGGMTSGWDVAECFRAERPDVPLLYVSGEVINPERCVPGSVFVAKPYRHTDVLSACQRSAAARQMTAARWRFLSQPGKSFFRREYFLNTHLINQMSPPKIR